MLNIMSPKKGKAVEGSVSTEAGYIRYLLVILLTAFCYSSAAVAQPTLVIENGRVFVGNGKVYETASVVIAGDSIYSMTQKSVEALKIRHIDASGKTVLPGLIDAHVHLTISPTGLDSVSMVKHLQNEVPDILSSFLSKGVTTIRSAGDFWPWVGHLRDSIAAEKIPGPRIIVAGPFFTVKGAQPVNGACGDIPFCRSHLAQVVTSPKEARRAVQQLASEGVDFIKLLSDTRMNQVRIDDNIVQAIVEQTHKEKLRVVGHVIGAEFMERYANLNMDGFVHPPSITGYSPLSQERVQKLAHNLVGYGTPITSTLAVSLFHKEKPETAYNPDSPLKAEIKSRAQNLSILADAGGPIIVGSDWRPLPEMHEYLQPGNVTITEMIMLQKAGISRKAILLSATSRAAQALELYNQIGTIHEGKIADLIVVDGNPLKNLSALKNIQFVIKNGHIVNKK